MRRYTLGSNLLATHSLDLQTVFLNTSSQSIDGYSLQKIDEYSFQKVYQLRASQAFLNCSLATLIL